MLPDIGKAMSAVADLDSRLEQVANQQRLTNGLLALLVLFASDPTFKITEQERVTCIAIARTAFNDRVPST